MKIIVLAGGRSDEHDVSMSSGSMIANALIEKEHQVVLVDLSKGVPEATTFDEAYSQYEKNRYSAAISTSFTKRTGAEIGENIIAVCSSADIVFLGLHGGIGENGQLAALFDIYQIKYTGSGYQGSLLAMNKRISKELLRFNGFPTADWTVAPSESELAEIKLPAVVKPLDNGSSIGVVLADNFEELKKAVCDTLEYSKNGEILIEEKIEGREFSVGVLGDTALPVIEIRPKTGFYDYINKYQDHLTEELVPAPIPIELTKRLQTLAAAAHDMLGLEVYSRTDFIVSDSGEPFIIEINSLPGMTPNSLLPQEAAASGLSFGDLCQKIVDLSLKK